MRVLFTDLVAYKPYTCDTLRSEALGGTEATVLRVARGLAQRGHEVALFQGIDAGRSETTIDGILHVNAGSEIKPDAVVHLRTAQAVAGFREHWPEARHLVWMHDLGGAWSRTEPVQGEELVCVSDFHAKQINEHLDEAPKAIHRIYNVVEVDGMRYPKVRGRLGFFSSPHKGLNQTIDAFFALSQSRPELSLVIANPGYIPNGPGGSAIGITNLGQLPHHRVMEEMSRCEVLFYPQTAVPETFGLVLAEANAMGTPVISHDHGAAMEVLMGANAGCNSVIQADDPAIIAHALHESLNRGGKSAPALDPRFAIDAVIADWCNLLEGK